jgi:hypothetical protein
MSEPTAPETDAARASLSREWGAAARWAVVLGFWLAWHFTCAVGAMFAVWSECPHPRYWPPCGNAADAAMFAWGVTLPSAAVAMTLGMRLRRWANIYYLTLWLLLLLAWMVVLAWSRWIPLVIQGVVPIIAAFGVRRVVEYQAAKSGLDS